MPILQESPDERPQKFKQEKKAFYGTAQESLEVRPGDVYQDETKRFTAICGDVLDLEGMGLLHKWIDYVDVVYSDIPWTPAIYTQFYTNADKKPKKEFSGFLVALPSVLERICPSGLVFIECGDRYSEQCFTALEAAGGKTLRVLNCTYTERRTIFKVWCGTFGRATLPVNFTREGMHSKAILYHAIDQCVTEKTRFYDPCCGTMTFLLPAVKTGATLFGTELIPRKFAEGIRSMRRAFPSLRKIWDIRNGPSK